MPAAQRPLAPEQAIVQLERFLADAEPERYSTAQAVCLPPRQRRLLPRRGIFGAP